VSELCTDVCALGSPFGEVLAFLFLAAWGAVKHWQTRKLRAEVRELSTRPPAPIPVQFSLPPGAFGLAPPPPYRPSIRNDNDGGNDDET
jgi:hypothetical protein